MYVVTNVLSAFSWIALAFLIHKTRVKYAPNTVQRWVKRLTYTFKAFCGLSAVRSLTNILTVLHTMQTVQSQIFILNNIALAVLVGYTSIYYRELPKFLQRLADHQKRSHRFSALADVASDAMIELDREGYIWYANAAAERMFQLAHEDILGMNFIDELTAPSTRKIFIGMRDQYQAGVDQDIMNRTDPTEIELIRNRSPFKAAITIARYELGGVERFICVIRDVTRRVKLQPNTVTTNESD